MSSLSHDFIRFALDQNVLRFGEFKTKAGGFVAVLLQLWSVSGWCCFGQARRVLCWPLAGIGPAVRHAVRPGLQGHTAGRRHLGRAGTARPELPVCLQPQRSQRSRRGGYCIVGAPLKGRVLIVDDVISAGTSVRESVELIRNQGATPAGVLIALDRMERGTGELSAVQEVSASYGIPVIAIANLADLLDFLKDNNGLASHRPAVAAYREQYGV